MNCSICTTPVEFNRRIISQCVANRHKYAAPGGEAWTVHLAFQCIKCHAHHHVSYNSSVDPRPKMRELNLYRNTPEEFAELDAGTKKFTEES